MTCSVVEICKRFGGTCCLHYQGESVVVAVDGSDDDDDRGGNRLLRNFGALVLLHSFTYQTTLILTD
jgi:hypothetical protein